jgi:glucose-6-phosphate isomerase
MSLHYKNLDQTKAGKKVLKAVKSAKLRQLLVADRVRAYQVQGAAGWKFYYGARAVDDKILGLLQNLSDEQQLVRKYRELVNGEVINTGENRLVLHHLTRGVVDKPVRWSGKDLGAFYSDQWQKIKDFADKIHKGEIKASKGKKFSTVVQIGIGGSDLGPRAMFLALENWVKKEKGGLLMDARFVSNVDPDDASAVLSAVPLETTLFILVSKSGTTQETLANENFVRETLTKAGLEPNAHMVTVTSETSPLAKSPRYLASFFIDDFIGGRYSSTSAVGTAILALALGKDVVEDFLKGAHAADLSALEPQITKNPALLDALIGVWERNGLGYPTTAVLPYSQALSRFPAHLQQLDMESNGKRVNRFGKSLNYSTGPIVFGEPGTNGQHSFYQLLHQGTDPVPLQFIGFLDSQRGDDVLSEGSTSQAKLKANLAAQIVAFAKGQKHEDSNKSFPGNRPSSLLVNKRLSPEALGALLAHFENKVMFQGFVWNINSFDQEGVQLGKLLTKTVLAKGDMDPALQAYAEILGV